MMRVFSLLCVGSMVFTGAVVAQQPLRVSLGVGYGNQGIACGGTCGEERRSGPIGIVTVHYRLNPHLYIGLEAGGWDNLDKGVDRYELHYAASATTYIDRAGKFFARFGLGSMAYRFNTDLARVRGDGLAGTISLGVDVPIAQRVHLSPFIGVITTLNRMTINVDPQPNILGYSPPDWGVHVIQAGMAFTYR